MPAQFPFALPQVPEFRVITRTQGVDQYALNYHDYCHGDGSATQVTADSLEALGIDARSENPLLPNAAILRGAEALDAILNAADAGSPDVPNAMNAGRILCSSDTDATPTPFHSPPLAGAFPRASAAPPFVPRACAVCQLGGLIYVTLLGIMVLVLINFLPLVNFIFQLLFDGCVACIDAVGTKEGRGRLKQNAKAARAGIGAARSAAKGAMSQARGGGGGGGGNPKAPFGANFFKASAGDSAAFDANEVHLTAQQVRSLKRLRRAQHTEAISATGAATTGTSFGQRLRRMGSHVINLGEPSSQEGRSLLKSQDDGISPPSSPPPPPLEEEGWA